MTTRNLEYFFHPRSVAIIGASRDPRSVGGVVTHNLQTGGYAGRLMRVNQRLATVPAQDVYRDIDELPEAPELAVVVVPAPDVPAIIGQLGARGTRAAVVLSAGFGELQDQAGSELQAEALRAAQPHLLRIVGPNCLGVVVPGVGLNASFVHRMALPGKLAFISQSGAIMTAVIDWANGRRIGFSHLISLGAMSDVDFGDLLDYLAQDHETSAVLLYVESIRHARKFMSAARMAARIKPVIVVKGGRNAHAAQAVASHTGNLAGADAVYDAAFRRAGMLRVDSLTELFDAVETLAHSPRIFGDRLALLTNGGGIGVLAVDDLVRVGGRPAPLEPATRQALAERLTPLCTVDNPVDILGDAPPDRYRAAMEVLIKAREVDAVAVFNCPIAVTTGLDAAQAVIDAIGNSRRPVLTNWLGIDAAGPARRLFAEHHIPTYATPDQLVRAFMHMVNFRRNQRLLLETPASLPEHFLPAAAPARRLLQEAVETGNAWLDPTATATLLDHYQIACVETLPAADADAAAHQAERLPAPYALKIVSPDIVHKSAVGGAALNLQTPAAVREAATAMHERLTAKMPSARLSGFIVQPMVRRAHAHELICGVSHDPTFGPVVLFGQGGTTVELVKDTAFELPPLNMTLACSLIDRTRVSQLLDGAPGLPRAHRDAIALTLIKLAQLVADQDIVQEIEINPLLADERGVLALDARVRLGAPTQGARFAIRPYPQELERPFKLVDGQEMLLRPIQPEDEPALVRLFESLTDEERYMRFFSPMPKFPHQLAARMSQIDYDREMALLIAERKPPGQAEIVGGARIAGDPNNERAEFGISVRHDYAGQGLGTRLMHAIIDYTRSRGYREIYGEIMAQNQPMLRICRELGFTIKSSPEGPAIRRATLALEAA